MPFTFSAALDPEGYFLFIFCHRDFFNKSSLKSYKPRTKPNSYKVNHITNFDFNRNVCENWTKSQRKDCVLNSFNSFPTIDGFFQISVFSLLNDRGRY